MVWEVHGHLGHPQSVHTHQAPQIRHPRYVLRIAGWWREYTATIVVSLNPRKVKLWLLGANSNGLSMISLLYHPVCLIAQSSSPSGEKGNLREESEK